MVKITEVLIRKKSEHNEGEISTLKELSLHQESIEKIEHIQDWCRDLEILLLQGNLIARIENLNKLKRLQYLNLAINNIEIVNNLERCESLQKLDLTLNFIGNIESVCNLKANIHLHELYLTGNPCADFNHYRHYIIYNLPQVTNLDGSEIIRSERLKAAQLFDVMEKQVLTEQTEYIKRRTEQRIRLAGLGTSDVPDEEFWLQESEHCPEVRIEMATRIKRQMPEKENTANSIKPVSLFSKDGRPLNLNQAKLKFNLTDENNILELHVEIYKHLDSSLLQVDLHPTYVTVTIKKKIFQLALPEEINVDKSVAQRSSTTGYLVIRMPKINQTCPIKTDVSTSKKVIKNDISTLETKERREYLEIGIDKLHTLFNITQYEENQSEQVDDSEVPPLE